MRLLAAAVLAFSSAGVAPCLAQDAPTAPAAAQPAPENLALAQEIIDLAYPPERRHALLSRTGDTIGVQARNAVLAGIGRQLDAGEEQIFQNYLNRVRVISERAITERSPALFAAFARAYARMFTHDELVQIRAFVSTPTGMKYIERSADLLADPDVAQANTAYMQSAFASIQPLLTQLRQEMLDYHARHQAPAPPTGSRGH